MKDLVAAGIYQDRTVERTNAALERGDNVFITAPTGSGKTRMTVAVMRKEIERGGRGVIMHEKRGLAEQSAKVARDAGLNAIAWFGDRKADPGAADVVYTTVDAVDADATRFGKITLYGVDEAHHAADKGGGQYDRAIDALQANNPSARMLSTTATRNRPDGLMLHPSIDRAVQVNVSWIETMEAGMVLPTRTKTRERRIATGETLQAIARTMIDPSDPSRSQIGINGVMRRHRRPDDMEAIAADFLIDTFREQREQALRDDRPFKGRVPEKTLAFTDRIEDAEALAQALDSRGIAAAAIHSRMKPERQNEIKADYAASRIEALVSVDLLGEGFDSPDTRRVLCAKATTSNLEYVQMVNRATRAEGPKTHGAIHDYGVSSMMHGKTEIYAAIEAYVEPVATPKVPVRPENVFKSDWKPWIRPVPDAANVWGVDLGDRQLFSARVSAEKILLMEIRHAGDKARIVSLGTMTGAELGRRGREAIGGSMRTVVSLCSDIGHDGRSRMERQVEAAWKRNGPSMNIYIAKARQAAKAASVPMPARKTTGIGD